MTDRIDVTQQLSPPQSPRVKSLNLSGHHTPAHITRLRVAILGPRAQHFISMLCKRRTRCNPIEDVMCDRAYECMHPVAGTPLTIVFTESYLFESYVSMLETSVQSADCIMMTYDRGDEEASLDDIRKRFAATITAIKKSRDDEATSLRPFLVLLIGVGATSPDAKKSTAIEETKVALSASFAAVVASQHEAQDIIDTIVTCYEQVMSYAQKSAASSAPNSPMSIASSSSSSSSSALSSPLRLTDIFVSPPSSSRSTASMSAPGTPSGPAGSKPDSGRRNAGPSSQNSSPRSDCSMQ